MEIKNIFQRQWQYCETENFIRYIRPLNREVYADELEKQEVHLRKFCEIFEVRLDKRITIYTVADRKEMLNLIGREFNGKAFSKKWEVFSVYLYSPHETVHILSDNLMGKPNNLFSEGLAVFFGQDNSFWHGKPLNYWMDDFIKNKKIIPLSELCDDIKFRTQFEEYITYPESGAFVNFLIKKFGIAEFKELYGAVGWKKPVQETLSILENVLKTDFRELEENFINFYL